MEVMYDLVIIGAGPAGLMTAISAGELGLKVSIIEKKSDVSQIRRACCAQFVMDDGYANELIEVKEGKIIFTKNQFEVSYAGAAIDVLNKYYYSPKGSRIHFAHQDGKPLAVKFDKGALLKGLKEKAEGLGIEFRLGTVAYSAKDTAEGVAVEITSKNKHSTIKAKKAVVAEGVNAHITGAFDLNEGRMAITTALIVKVALQGTSGFEPQSWNLFYGQAYRSNAAVIIGPSLYGDDVVEMTLMGNAQTTPNMIFEGVTTQSPLAERFKNSKVIDKQGCSVKAYSSIRKPYKGNVLAIGDAAAYVEVETQGALMCGFHAGKAVAKELSGEKGFEQYSTWWNDSFEFNSDDWLKVAQGYALVPTYTDDELDYLFALTEDEILEGSYSQYKTPELLWASILRHKDKIADKMPHIYEKIKRNSQMTLSATF